jgi:hypothetical protein
MKLTTWLGLASAVLFCSGTAAQTPAPRYAQAIEDELDDMGVDAHCELRADHSQHCSYDRSSMRVASLEVDAVYSDESDTIYVYVPRYLVLPPDARSTPTVLRRLMELNWDLLLGKFEWNPRTGEVRLSAMLSTDSNFDRRAFRSILHGLESLAARHRAELRGMASP